jgi:hypothetical protein
MLLFYDLTFVSLFKAQEELEKDRTFLVPEVNILHETSEPARVHSTYVQSKLANEAVQGPPSNVPTDQPLHQVSYGSNDLDLLSGVKPGNDVSKVDKNEVKGDFAAKDNKKSDPFSSLFDDDLLKDLAQDNDYSPNKTTKSDPVDSTSYSQQQPSKLGSFGNNLSRAPLNPISKPPGDDNFQDSFLSDAPMSRLVILALTPPLASYHCFPYQIYQTSQVPTWTAINSTELECCFQWLRWGRWKL